MAVEREHPHFSIHWYVNWFFRFISPLGPTSAVSVWSSRISGLVSFMGIFSLTLLPFADAGEKDIHPIVQPFAAWAFGHRFSIACWILAASTITSVLNWLIQRFFLFDVEKMREILDVAVAYHFVDQNRSEHCYRATLFKVCHVWPFGRWLGIVSRSGENHHGSKTILSYDRMKHTRCTGIAGECAWQKAIQICCIPHPKTASEAYALAGFLAEPERKMFNVYSLVFFAVPIDRQDGKLWGVLVLDSTDTIAKVESEEKRERVREALGHWALAIKTAIH
jgi:hypothetical protein